MYRMNFPRSSISRRFTSLMTSSNSGSSNQQNKSLNAGTGGDDNLSASSQNELNRHQQACSRCTCNICLDLARDAVISKCGHLFCWPCLYRWLYETDLTSGGPKTCPVCKSGIDPRLDPSSVIPFYGLGEINGEDPRKRLPYPTRPQGQRTEVPTSQRGDYHNEWFFNFAFMGFHTQFNSGTIHSSWMTFLQEIQRANGDRHDTEFFFGAFFAIVSFLCVLCTILYC